MVRPKLERDPDPSYNVLRSLLLFFFPPAASLRLARHLVSLLVGLSLIPLLFLLSLFSGWYVWKNIPVSWQVPVYLQYGHEPSPYAELSLPPLSTSQPYDVSLQLLLPASDANLALGNFMTTLSLSASSNKTLLTISRPSIVLPPKRPVFSFSTIPRLVDLHIPLLSSYIPDTATVHARIDIGRRDGWRNLGNGEGRELSVWNAALKGAVRLRGVRGLLSRFPLTFALLASTTFFSLSVFVLVAAIHWRVSTDEAPSTSEPKEDKPVRVRKRPRRTVANESRAPNPVFKSEDISIDIPSTLASDDLPLKRRRSRVSDELLD